MLYQLFSRRRWRGPAPCGDTDWRDRHLLAPKREGAVSRTRAVERASRVCGGAGSPIPGPVSESVSTPSSVTTVEPLPPLPGSSPRPPSQPPAPSARSIPTQLPEGPARVWIRPGPPLAPGRAALGDPALPSPHAPASPQGPGSTAQAQPRQPPACSRGLCTDPVPPGPASPSFSFDCLSTLALSGHLGSGRARTGTGATFSAVVSTWSCALKCHWLPPPSWVIREASRVHSSLGPRPARHDLSGVTETPLPEAPCHERPCCRAQLGLFLAAGSGPHVLVSARSPLQPGCSSSFLHGLSPNSHLGGPSSP